MTRILFLPGSPLFLMNFMFHSMLDAAGVVLRVHYKSINCDVLDEHCVSHHA